MYPGQDRYPCIQDRKGIHVSRIEQVSMYPDSTGIRVSSVGYVLMYPGQGKDPCIQDRTSIHASRIGKVSVYPGQNMDPFIQDRTCFQNRKGNHVSKIWTGIIVSRIGKVSMYPGQDRYPCIQDRTGLSDVWDQTVYRPETRMKGLNILEK